MYLHASCSEEKVSEALSEEKVVVSKLKNRFGSFFVIPFVDIYENLTMFYDVMMVPSTFSRISLFNSLDRKMTSFRQSENIIVI